MDSKYSMNNRWRMSRMEPKKWLSIFSIKCKESKSSESWLCYRKAKQEVAGLRSCHQLMLLPLVETRITGHLLCLRPYQRP